MKKSLLILAMAIAIIPSVFGQKLKESDVPVSVKEAFKKSFPGMNAKWEKENGNFEAGFKKDGKTMSATFKPSGEFIESETSIKESELPPAAVNYVKANYKDKKIKETAKITDAKGVVTYEAEVDDKDLIFDSLGKYLKAVKN
jgi:Putative beta-lactamase-inhibitor-like, PepSY-like